MGFAAALAEFQAARREGPNLRLVSTETGQFSRHFVSTDGEDSPPLFIQTPNAIVSEADLERALAQEGV